ncbi:unnamed protein product [marine sediment metagenome]|uniref:Uncharacterized protein n=1 Tax=marine sediment metagenome TaxID=412755 RepID=X1HA75_9ZZZZ
MKMNKFKEQTKRYYEENWEKIDAVVHVLNPSVGVHGIYYRISYKNITIARLYCSGNVDFINQEKWKKGWEFKFAWNGDEKFFYRYIGK